MKEWSKPELLSLNVQLTNAGGYGMPIDGTVYNVDGEILVGTSGPALDHPLAE